MPEQSPTSSTSDAIRVTAELLGDLVIRDTPLNRLSTYRVAGHAALLVECQTMDHLGAVADAVGQTAVPVLVVGRGSNLLVADRGFAGLVVHLTGGFTRWTLDAEAASAVARGGAALPRVSAASGGAGLHGIEWAIGIPGTIGGAVAMNAGLAEGDKCMADVVTGVDVLNLLSGRMEQWAKAACGFGFRTSAVRAWHVVTSVSLALTHGDPQECAMLQERALKHRKLSQPGGRNAGSVFVNRNAWKLIEDADASGIRVGCASISTVHKNFIVVDPKATVGADDVFELMCRVRAQVRDRLGVVLRTETHLAGFTPAELERLFGD